VIAHGHLAIGDEHDFVVLAYAQNRGAVHQWAFPAIAHPPIIAPEESMRQNHQNMGRTWEATGESVRNKLKASEQKTE